MKLCQRCAIQPASNTVAGLPMCGVCTAQLDWRYGAPKSQVSGASQVGALSDVTPWGLAVPPLGLYQAMKGSGESGSDDGGGLTGTANRAADAVKETASSVKTIALVVGAIAGVSLIYIIYKQAQNARAATHEAFQVFGSNPNLQHAATHAILL